MHSTLTVLSLSPGQAIFLEDDIEMDPAMFQVAEAAIHACDSDQPVIVFLSCEWDSNLKLNQERPSVALLEGKYELKPIVMAEWMNQGTRG